MASKRQTSARGVKRAKNLPARTLKAKAAKKVKGGVSLSYGAIEWTYTKQKPDGTPPQK